MIVYILITRTHSCEIIINILLHYLYLLFHKYRIRLYVEQHMIHKCSTAINGCKNSTTCKCKRGYDDTLIQSETTFDDRGFPVYKRDYDCDLDVVPHNKFLLLDWNGHANVEYAGNSQCVLYLYKYLYKGAKKVKLRLTNVDEVSDNDEITLYLRGRFLCAMDAMWRTLGYHTYPSSSPGVQTITVKMPEMVQYLVHNGKSCDMLIYFNRPPQLINIKYTELFKNYTVKDKLSARLSEQDENDLDGYFIIKVPGLRNLYLQRRSDRTLSIIRMEMLYITSGTLNILICYNIQILYIYIYIYIYTLHFYSFKILKLKTRKKKTDINLNTNLKNKNSL